MDPQKGQYVKVIFRNGAQAEGYVVSWSDQKSVLTSSDGQSFFIIQKTTEDVMAVKIILEEIKALPQLEVELDEIEEKFEEVYTQPSDSDLRLKNLAQLKAAMVEQEKKIVAEKLKSHTFSGVRKTNYEHGFFKK